MTNITLIHKNGKSEKFTEVIKFASAFIQTSEPPNQPVPSYIIGTQKGMTYIRTLAEINLFFVD